MRQAPTPIPDAAGGEPVHGAAKPDGRNSQVHFQHSQLVLCHFK
jgi:hypothetical protein